MLWGPPGIGKSEIVRQVADDINYNLIDLRLSTLDAPELRGLSFIDQQEKSTVWFRPEFLPTKKDARSIIFLDELNRGTPDTQGSALQLILDRRIGNHVLPDETLMIAAANPPDEGEIVYELTNAMKNRLMHVMVRPDLESFMDWALNNSIHPHVLTFLKVKPEFLYGGPKPNPENYVFPTPRTWKWVSDVLKRNIGTARVEKSAVAGLVGDASSTSFYAVIDEIGELPEISTLLNTKTENAAKMVPDKLSPLYGLTYSLLPVCNKAETYEKALDLLAYLSDKKGGNKDLPRLEVCSMGIELLLKQIRTRDSAKVKLTELMNKCPHFNKYMSKMKTPASK